MTFDSWLKGLSDKRVAVIGIGVSNQPLIELLLSRGIAVTACDRKDRAALGELGGKWEAQGCRLKLGDDYLKDLDADVIFRTPGMRPDLPELEAAIARGAVLTSEMEAFFEVCPCPMIAVTGSDGKTTTTTIIAKLLEAAGKRVWLGGNIGHPLLCDTPEMRPDDVAVLELSSFQLLTMKKSPHIAVITNLSPNHLDVHKDMAEYVTAKEQIFLHQKAGDVLVLNRDNDLTRDCASRAVPGAEVRFFSRQKSLEKGVSFHNDVIFRDGAEVLRRAGIRLPGLHNVENYMAAIAAVEGLVPDDVIRAFAKDFGGVEHRIEFVRELGGVKYYNDSIASSPSRTIAGLRSFDQKVILIAGGKDKGISYAAIGPEINEHVKALVLCGKTAGVIRAATEQADNFNGLPIVEADDYPAAVAAARSFAVPGDVVILSPASTSFDRFKNFMERGQVFKDIVNALS